MSKKHTPGPWRLVRNQFSEYCSTELCEMAVMSGGDMNMIVAGVVSDCLEEHQANARLISAAPELLQALVNLVQALQPDENGKICLSDVEFVETEARGVIYKATGEEA